MLSPKLNIKIVTLALNLPGPIAVARLKKLGASIVKIEPSEGDPLKRYSLEWYQRLIVGQEVINLNLRVSEHRQILDSYLKNSDLLITSMRPQTLKKLELDSISSKFPQISHLEIIGYTGEKENFAGHDLTYQAELGLLTPPALPRTLFADLMAAERVFSTALLQIILKFKNQTATHQRVSITESLTDCLLPIKYKMTWQGNLLGGGFAGYNLYQTSDGWIALAALETHFWSRLLENLELEAADVNTLNRIFSTKSSSFWSDWGKKLDLPIAEVI